VSTVRAIAIFVALPFFGCGGPAETVAVVTGPFTPDHELVFEDGIDLVRDPRVLEGSWLEDWENELDRRVGLSDIVALVTIRTLRTYVDLDRNRTYGLVGEVDRVLFGENVGQELALVVREGHGGFGTIENNERRILDEQYIAFVKWAEEPDGSVRARWHLSPATDQVAVRVRSLLSRRRPDTEGDGTHRRVIVHRN
jgi:hypothetical protein